MDYLHLSPNTEVKTILNWTQSQTSCELCTKKAITERYTFLDLGDFKQTILRR